MLSVLHLEKFISVLIRELLTQIPWPLCFYDETTKWNKDRLRHLFSTTGMHHWLLWERWKNLKVRSWIITDLLSVSLCRYVLKDSEHESVSAICISVQLFLPPQLLQNKHLSYSTHFKTLLKYIFFLVVDSKYRGQSWPSHHICCPQNQSSLFQIQVNTSPFVPHFALVLWHNSEILYQHLLVEWETPVKRFHRVEES